MLNTWFTAHDHKHELRISSFQVMICPHIDHVKGAHVINLTLSMGDEAQRELVAEQVHSQACLLPRICACGVQASIFLKAPQLIPVQF